MRRPHGRRVIFKWGRSATQRPSRGRDGTYSAFGMPALDASVFGRAHLRPFARPDPDAPAAPIRCAERSARSDRWASRATRVRHYRGARVDRSHPRLRPAGDRCGVTGSRPRRRAPPVLACGAHGPACRRSSLPGGEAVGRAPHRSTTRCPSTASPRGRRVRCSRSPVSERRAPSRRGSGGASARGPTGPPRVRVSSAFAATRDGPE